MTIEFKKIGKYRNEDVIKYKITNNKMNKISLMSYAATWMEFIILDNNIPVSLIDSYNNLEEYINSEFQVGKTVGRVAGRIRNGQFYIDDKKFRITPNENNNLLHGGTDGFQNQNFKSEIINKNKVLFYKTLSDDNGFEGDLNIGITYELTDNDEVIIEYSGETTKDTLFNPTCHVYFDLGDDSINSKELFINSKSHIELNDEKLPTGKLLKNSNAFDFHNFKTVGRGLEQLGDRGKQEFDDCFEVEDDYVGTIKNKKYRIDLYSDRNGLVVYTANTHNKEKHINHDYNSLAMELQTLPDAINHENFGNIILTKGDSKRYVNRYCYEKIVKN